MKSLILSILITIMFAGSTFGQHDNASVVAAKIAQKMKDSLALTQSQFNDIYAINMQLYNQKRVVRHTYTNMDSLRFYFQKVESTRDSLYRSVLDTNQILIYKQKKRYLISVQ